MQILKSLSFAPAVKHWLANTHHPRILHVFDHACNLINERGDVLSIVTPQIGNGPFNLVIRENILLSEHCDAESHVTINNNIIRLGNISVNTENAQLWDPRPHWESLHSNLDHICNQLLKLPMTDHLSSFSGFSYAIANADTSASIIIAKQLAGLGIGLTPAGDDFIMGALYAAWIIHPLEIARTLATRVADETSALTTSLSATWIKSAGRGEAGIRWHEFFCALVLFDVDQIHFAKNNILAVGETSGADALAGFTHTFISYAESKDHVVPKLV